MDPRMAAREWFLDKPGKNTYDIEAHVQRSFWHHGFGQAFFRCIKANPPYKCVGFWRGQAIELEWTPRQWLAVSMPKFDQGIVEGVSSIIRLEPALQYTMKASHNGYPVAETENTAAAAAEEAGTDERVVVEWRVRNADQRLKELEEQAGISHVQML